MFYNNLREENKQLKEENEKLKEENMFKDGQINALEAQIGLKQLVATKDEKIADLEAIIQLSK
jgi:cell division protein FtsB